MAVNFSNSVYLIAFDKFARPITVTPTKSQPSADPYPARGIFDSKETDVMGIDGQVFSDSRTILDIRQQEFAVMPIQGDRIFIPDHENVAGGTFDVEDLGGIGNAGGEITLYLRRVVEAKP